MKDDHEALRQHSAWHLRSELHHRGIATRTDPHNPLRVIATDGTSEVEAVLLFAVRWCWCWRLARTQEGGTDFTRLRMGQEHRLAQEISAALKAAGLPQ